MFTSLHTHILYIYYMFIIFRFVDFVSQVCEFESRECFRSCIKQLFYPDSWYEASSLLVYHPCQGSSVLAGGSGWRPSRLVSAVSLHQHGCICHVWYVSIRVSWCILVDGSLFGCGRVIVFMGVFTDLLIVWKVGGQLGAFKRLVRKCGRNYLLYLIMDSFCLSLTHESVFGVFSGTWVLPLPWTDVNSSMFVTFTLQVVESSWVWWVTYRFDSWTGSVFVILQVYLYSII